VDESSLEQPQEASWAKQFEKSEAKVSSQTAGDKRPGKQIQGASPPVWRNAPPWGCSNCQPSV